MFPAAISSAINPNNSEARRLREQPNSLLQCVDARLIYDAAPQVKKPPMPWHCLRHSFCRALAAAGTPITIIKELAGHASIETTLRYVHVTAEEKRAAIDAVFGTPGEEPESSNCPVIAPSKPKK